MLDNSKMIIPPLIGLFKIIIPLFDELQVSFSKYFIIQESSFGCMFYKDIFAVSEFNINSLSQCFRYC